MTDRELLEKAAKAVGMQFSEERDMGGNLIGYKALYPESGCWGYWNPLIDDDSAMRLAVKAGICIEPYPIYSEKKHSVITKQRRQSDQIREANPTECVEVYNDEPFAATRRAIVRAAAAIGEKMP